MPDHTTTLKNFIKKRRYLFWYVKEPEKNLGPESVVEAVLNYGDWDDVQTLIKIMGIKKVAKIFREKSKPSEIGRQNYRERAKNYFSLYFDKYVPL